MPPKLCFSFGEDESSLQLMDLKNNLSVEARGADKQLWATGSARSKAIAARAHMTVGDQWSTVLRRKTVLWPRVCVCV